MAESKLDQAVLQSRIEKEIPSASPLGNQELLKQAGLSDAYLALLEKPSLELTARYPYADFGCIDADVPAGWWCGGDRIQMTPVKPGEEKWSGTVVFVHFEAPADGLYLVSASFTGYAITMEMYTASTVSTGYCQTMSSFVPVCTLWTGKKGDNLNLMLTCLATTDPSSDAWLEAVRFYWLSG